VVGGVRVGPGWGGVAAGGTERGSYGGAIRTRPSTKVVLLFPKHDENEDNALSRIRVETV